MKKHSPSGITAYCRLFLKLSSGLFLLFFACVSPIAPVLAQAGSAIFIFLLIVLSPFAPDKSKLAAAPQPNDLPRAYQQMENDSPGPKLAIQQSNQQQSFYLQTILAAEKKFEKVQPEIQRFSIKIITYSLPKPENWQSCCKPVRAGPISPAV